MAISAFSALAGALPWGVGQYPVARRYLGSSRWRPATYAEQTMSNGSRVRVDLGDATQLSAYLLRDYAPELTRFIAPRCRPDGIVFDVGAHIGLVSFAIAALRPDVAIRAFEPNPRNAAAWRRNHALNPGARAELVEAAVSSHESGARLSVPSDSGSGLLGEIGAPVVTVTLDAYCQRSGIDFIDVVKLDVEGHESEALAGAAGLLADRAIRVVVCEVKHADRAEVDPSSILARHGYRRISIPPFGLAGRLLGRSHAQDAAFEA